MTRRTLIIGLEILAAICWWLAFLVLPPRYIPLLICSVLFACGFWGLLFPRSMVRWFKRWHPSYDPDDKRLLWSMRCIGTVLLITTFLLASAAISENWH